MTPYYQDDAVTIFHADCREVLPAVVADVVITDPPYGIRFDTNFGRFNGNHPAWQPIAQDQVPFDPAPLLTGPAVLFGANYYSDRLPVGRWVIWNKRDVQQSKMLLADAEMIWHNCGGQAVRVFNWFWQGCYRKGEMRTAYHPAQKPLALMTYLVEQFTQPGNLILDPFMGSGTTLRAAKDLGRHAIGIEIEERYCEIAVRRLAQGVLTW